MTKEVFYNVHKDFTQDGTNGPIYGHEQYLGMTEAQAKAKYHQLLSSVYQYNDPWTFVFIVRDDGMMIEGEKVDRRTPPAPAQTSAQIPEEE